MDPRAQTRREQLQRRLANRRAETAAAADTARDEYYRAVDAITAATVREITYGRANPILDRAIYRFRDAVRRDCLARGITLEEMARAQDAAVKDYCITPPEMCIAGWRPLPGGAVFVAPTARACVTLAEARLGTIMAFRTRPAADAYLAWVLNEGEPAAAPPDAAVAGFLGANTTFAETPERQRAVHLMVTIARMRCQIDALPRDSALRAQLEETMLAAGA